MFARRWALVSCLLLVGCASLVLAGVEDLEGNDKDVHMVPHESGPVSRRLAVGQISSKFHVCAASLDPEVENDLDFDFYNSDEGLVLSFEYHVKNETTGEMVHNELHMQVVITRIIEFYDIHKGFQPGQQIISEYSLVGKKWTGFQYQQDQVDKNITLISFSSSTTDDVISISGFITDQESLQSRGMSHLSPNHVFLKLHIKKFPHSAEFTTLALEAAITTKSKSPINYVDGEMVVASPTSPGVEGMFRWFPWVRTNNVDYPVSFHRSREYAYFTFMRKGAAHEVCDELWQPELGIRYVRQPASVSTSHMLLYMAVGFVTVMTVTLLAVVLWRVHAGKCKCCKRGDGTVEEKSTLIEHP